MTHSYPESPGWRKGSAITSREAAEVARTRAPRMMDLVLTVIAEHPSTPEEVHARLEASGHRALLNSVRARICQARAQGRVVDTGERGLGESGRARVIRWRMSTPSELADFLALREAEKAGAHV